MKIASISRVSRTRRSRTHRGKLSLECLESRILLTTEYVWTGRDQQHPDDFLKADNWEVVDAQDSVIQQVATVPPTTSDYNVTFETSAEVNLNAGYVTAPNIPVVNDFTVKNNAVVTLHLNGNNFAIWDALKVGVGATLTINDNGNLMTSVGLGHWVNDHGTGSVAVDGTLTIGDHTGLAGNVSCAVGDTGSLLIQDGGSVEVDSATVGGELSTGQISVTSGSFKSDSTSVAGLFSANTPFAIEADGSSSLDLGTLTLGDSDLLGGSMSVTNGATVHTSSVAINGIRGGDDVANGGQVYVDLDTGCTWRNDGAFVIRGNTAIYNQSNPVTAPVEFDIFDSEFDTASLTLGGAQASEGDVVLWAQYSALNATDVEVGSGQLDVDMKLDFETVATVKDRLLIDAQVDTGDLFNVSVIDGSTLKLSGEGGMQGLLEVRTGAILAAGTTVDAQLLHIDGYGDSVTLTNGAAMTVEGDSQIGPTADLPEYLPLVIPSAGNTIDVGNGSSFATVTATVGEAFVYVKSGGSFSVVGAEPLFLLQPGVLEVDGTVTADGGGGIQKNAGADIYGTGVIETGDEFVLTEGVNADILPGHVLTRAPDGTLHINDGASLGPLTIAGNLDASRAMTLDSYIDPSSHESSLLHVSGTATIAGTISLFFANYTTSDSFHAGDSFTMLTADGGLTGTFSNLAAGVQALPDPADPRSGMLPILPVGLRWLATYSSTSLVLSVIGISPAVITDVSTADLSLDTGYLGSRSVTITWTNNDPGILKTYIEVKEGGLSNSGDEGNFFTIGYVTGNTSTFSDIPGDGNTDTFQAGATYAIRLRTLTKAGAAYSEVYTYSVPPLTVDTSGLSLTYTAASGDPSSFSILLTGQETSATERLMGQSSAGPFPDRWAAVGDPSWYTTPADPSQG
ncbi:MAG TPA: hypothetical protein VHQ47_14200, partial [Phycisphaerae bacterium]|nr:hypothetical protein [Phycisphaerae bacterium]